MDTATLSGSNVNNAKPHEIESTRKRIRDYIEDDETRAAAK